MKDDTAAGSWREATKLVRAGLQRSGFCETSEALFKRADRALYLSKSSGRNRVTADGANAAAA